MNERLKVSTEDAGGEYRDVRPGRKLAQAVGMNRWTAGTGTLMLSVGFVVLRDAADGGDDSGLIFSERFALTSSAVFRLARWAKAQGYSGDFYPDDDEAILKIMAMGPVVATLAEDTYKGKTRTQVESFAQYTGGSDPGWDAKVMAGEQEYAAMRQRMDAASGGGGGGSPSARPAANSGHPNAPGNNAGPQHHSDIPF